MPTLAEIEAQMRNGTFKYSNGSTTQPDKSTYYNPPSFTPPTSKPSTPAPPTGYGGGNYYNLDRTGQKEMEDLGARLSSDPAYVQSEITRTNDVIKNRQSSGLDFASQTDYLNKLQGYLPTQSKAPITPPPTGGTPTPATPPTQSYTPPPPPKPSYDADAIAETIRKSYMVDINNQTAAINQALQQALQANELAVGKNKQALEEQIRALTQAKMDNDNQAQQLQNRRGGSYSGGLDFQLGNIAKASTQAQENVTRDVTERNADIYGRNALLAQQAADNIQRLQNAAPDKIRELIRQAINDEKQFGLQEGALTGYYNGQNTLNRDQYDTNKALQEGQLLGNYKGAQTLASQQFDWGKQMDLANLTGQLGGESTLAGKKANLDAALAVGQQTGRVVAPQQDWGNLFTNSGNSPLNLEGQKFQAQQQQLQDEKAYRSQRDSEEDRRWWSNYDREGQQFAAQQGLNWAQLNQRQQEFVADQAYKERALSAQNNDKNSAALKQELDGLYTGLQSGQINPAAAIDEINGKMRVGLLDPSQGSSMLALVQQFSQNRPQTPMNQFTEKEVQQMGGTNPQSMSMKDLEKLWESDPTGRASGTAKLDWMQWVRDPQGKSAGVSYNAYHQAYGPQLKAR